MLSSVSVTNIALIDRLELSLGAGLNILSGETGAGKSIIIDALNFVLGERADKSLIRHGTDFAAVEAVFSDYETPAVTAYMQDVGIEPEEVLVIRRKMSADGKNECRINGRVSTLSTLKGLTELLVDIHGQHEHQSLVKPANHEAMLDGVGGDKIAEARERTACIYRNYRTLKEELDTLGDESERARRLDILTYQLEEIERADIREGEEDELLEKRKRIRNMEKILSAIAGARESLDGYDGHSVTTSLKNAAAGLNGISSYDSRLDELCARLDEAKSEVADIAETLKDMAEELDFDSRSADEVEERLETVRGITRKYGGSFEALTAFYQKSKAEAEKLAGASERVGELEAELAAEGKKLASAAEHLGNLRRAAAERFEADMTRELVDLGMGGTTFKVDIRSDYAPESVGPTGGDKVEFLISPNVGEPLKPLAKIISGGEMSRFMLALKNIVAGIDGIGTMVFDEIDTGISGRISAVVAEKMCNISRARQVIAITHMPALAAMADSHFLIEKGVEDGKTLTHLTLLDDDTAEIARLVGGGEHWRRRTFHARGAARERDEKVGGGLQEVALRLTLRMALCPMRHETPECAWSWSKTCMVLKQNFEKDNPRGNSPRVFYPPKHQMPCPIGFPH